MSLTRRHFTLLAAGSAALSARAATIPRPSPEFVVRLPGGGGLPVSLYRGKVVALTFISTT